MKSLPKPPTFKSTRAKSESQSEPGDESQSETVGTPSKSSDEAAHLDGFIMPDIEAEDGDDPEGPITLDENGDPIDDGPPDTVDREAFFLLFRTAFDLPQSFIPEFAPLAVQPREERSARAASDAIFSLLEIYYPKALNINSPTLAHIMAAAPFIVGKIMVVREIIRAQKMAAQESAQGNQEAPQEQQPAPQAEPVHLSDWKLPNQGGQQ